MLEAFEWSRAACGDTACEGTAVPWTCRVWCGAAAVPNGLGVGVSAHVAVTRGSMRQAGLSGHGSTSWPGGEQERTPRSSTEHSLCRALGSAAQPRRHLSHTQLCRWFCPFDHSVVFFKMFLFCCLGAFVCSCAALKCKVVSPKKHLSVGVFFCGTSHPFNFGSLKSAEPGFSLCSPSEEQARSCTLPVHPRAFSPLIWNNWFFCGLIRVPFSAGTNSKADVLSHQSCPTTGKQASPAQMISKGIAGLGGEVRGAFLKNRARSICTATLLPFCPSVCSSLLCQHL